MKSIPAMPEDQVASVLQGIGLHATCYGCPDDVLPLLREDAAIYRGRGATEVELLRAHVMVRIGSAGMSDVLLPYVLEELETGLNPHALAAAARVARGVYHLPPEMPRLLMAAIDRIRHVDQFVQFDAYPPPSTGGYTTAVDELVETLASTGIGGRSELMALRKDVESGGHLTSRARALLRDVLDAIGKDANQTSATSDCCAGAARAEPSIVAAPRAHECSREHCSSADSQPLVSSIALLHNVELENQDGTRATFGQIFEGRPAVIGFFYTRCMNPNKCSRTISKLAALSQLLQTSPANGTATVAAISYDPDYDVSPRLRRYGEDRNWPFGDRYQLLRTTGSFAAVVDALRLGVGYGPTTVNRHRIELMLIDATGVIRDLRVRRLWNEADVLNVLSSVAMVSRS
ncbi:SCO family protein [Paraburkholderia sp. RL17-347-BIC-D]|uniref:SCO family protein n=1 Tax=Paraburkholderia sp. RL17-347-BIC-D TaxID=3031632 RepID=UPI0038B8387B